MDWRIGSRSPTGWRPISARNSSPNPGERSRSRARGRCAPRSWWRSDRGAAGRCEPGGRAFLYFPGGFPNPVSGGIKPMIDTLLYVALFAGVAALVLAVYYARVVLATPRGNERMVEISDAIREGAMAFLRREYTWVAVFVVAMAVLIGFLLEDGGFRALAYL